jgi:hypothetical protein
MGDPPFESEPPLVKQWCSGNHWFGHRLWRSRSSKGKVADNIFLVLLSLSSLPTSEPETTQNQFTHERHCTTLHLLSN